MLDRWYYLVLSLLYLNGILFASWTIGYEMGVKTKSEIIVYKNSLIILTILFAEMVVKKKENKPRDN